jgi:Domain of unknown function (DUF4160)
MPTLLRKGPYRFFCYASDRHEPPHIHVERDDKVAKYWLRPIRLQISYGFGSVEIRRIQTIIAHHHQDLLEGWNEYFAK